jgi:ribosomal protein S18 acetylase RimI-like enzyme
MLGQAPRACLERLRPAEPADQGECLRIWRETWPEAFSGRPLPPDEEFFRQTLGEEIFVVPGDRGLAGFVSLWLEEPFVHFLLVDGRYRRQGVGEALLRLAISRLPPPVHLKCAPGNAGALAFYARMGCTEVERVEAPGNAYVRLRLPEG